MCSLPAKASVIMDPALALSLSLWLLCYVAWQVLNQYSTCTALPVMHQGMYMLHACAQ